VDGTVVIDMDYNGIMDIILASGAKVTFVLAKSSDVDAHFSDPNAVPEASINDLLKATAPGFAIGEDASITTFLKTAGEDDPTAKAIRSKLYDVTVPFTTRPMRPGEVDGTHYNFCTVEAFKGYIAADALIEFGEHNGNFYGTMKVAAADSAGLQSRPGLVAPKVQEATIAGLFEFLKRINRPSFAAGYASEHGGMTISSFLRVVLTSKEAQHVKTRAAVRDAVYDFTTPFTTREVRQGEEQGREYVFITREQFSALVTDDRMLEWGERSGNCYGTPKLLANDLLPKTVGARHAQRRPTLVQAVENGPKEATLSTLLENVPEEFFPHKTPSEILNAPGGQSNATINKIQEQIRTAIYDLTIPLTTRKPRPGEVHGKDYNFVTTEEFVAYVDAGSMLEHGESNGTHYGTLKVSDAEISLLKQQNKETEVTYEEAEC
jgi:guanylate kinase